MIKILPWLSVAVACLIASLIGTDVTAAEPLDSVAFFENRIRPVLIESCYECHSADSDEVGGSLLLDSSGGMTTGGDSGPAIVPGDTEASALVSAIRYESSEMPPDGKLPDEVIQDFETWILTGAVDPRQDTSFDPPTTEQIDIESGRKFWSFQPLQLATGSIDEMLAERLDMSGISPNGPAPPELRLRRLSFDLTGLPPSDDLLQRWLADPSPAKWIRIVDELLASPGFAEQWARHWMDIARYADSNGGDFNATHHEAWRYRDYLVRSIANDQPLDHMIRQQIAGDLMPAADEAERHDNLVATTFLMIGTKMLSERDKAKLAMDVVDEQIDTVGRAFMGLTLGCARCHDHKFDPIPTEDYYALAGIFRSTRTLNGESQKYVSTWNRSTLPADEKQIAEIEKHKARLSTLKAKLKSAEAELESSHRSTNANGGIIVDDADAQKTGFWKPSVIFKHFVGEGYVHDDNKNKGMSSIKFSVRLKRAGKYEVRVSFSPSGNRAAHVPVTIGAAGDETIVFLDQRKTSIKPNWKSLGRFEFDIEHDASVTLHNDRTSGYVIADAVQFLPIDSENSETAKPSSAAADEDARHRTRVSAASRVDELKKEIKRHLADEPPSLPVAMAPADLPSDQISDCPIHVRGEVRNLGPVVPRGVLQVCVGEDSAIPSPVGSGRLELANWLTDPDNPLVARVFVNRVWMRLMGEGIVRTVDNFGLQGDRPSHPELLDSLAIEFLRDRWQLKPLIRDIVCSEAYARSSQFREDAITIDPENRLLWRMHRRRLPAESIRDAMLLVSGQLDRRPRYRLMEAFGTLVTKNNADSQADINQIAEPCRTLYLPIVRGYVPPLLRTLDVADPDLLVGKRPTTNVPAQALVLINSSEVNRWAGQTAKRICDEHTAFSQRLRSVCLDCLQREPTSEDREIANDFFSGREDSIDAWHEYVAATFAGTEFRLLD